MRRLEKLIQITGGLAKQADSSIIRPLGNHFTSKYDSVPEISRPAFTDSRKIGKRDGKYFDRNKYDSLITKARNDWNKSNPGVNPYGQLAFTDDTMVKNWKDAFRNTMDNRDTYYNQSFLNKGEIDTYEKSLQDKENYNKRLSYGRLQHTKLPGNPGQYRKDWRKDVGIRQTGGKTNDNYFSLNQQEDEAYNQHIADTYGDPTKEVPYTPPKPDPNDWYNAMQTYSANPTEENKTKMQAGNLREKFRNIWGTDEQNVQDVYKNRASYLQPKSVVPKPVVPKPNPTINKPYDLAGAEKAMQARIAEKRKKSQVLNTEMQARRKMVDNKNKEQQRKLDYAWETTK